MYPSDGCARCTPTPNWRSHTNRAQHSRTARKFRSKEIPGRSEGFRGQEFMLSKSGFEEGWIAEAIVGAKDCQHGIFYLVKWKDRDDIELIPAFTTLTHVPSLVIHFYATRLGWIASAMSTTDPG